MYHPVSWAGTLALTIMDWRKGGAVRPRDPPFVPPTMANDEDAEEIASMHRRDDTESTYDPIPPIRRQTSDDMGSGPVRSPFSDENRYNSSSGGGYGGGGGGGYSAPVAAGRPSMDAYGAFSDPAPSGYGSSSPAPQPGVSRTMQYADPYAAVRASIAGPSAHQPPTYDSYGGGYR
jgi:hypothetical protein